MNVRTLIGLNPENVILDKRLHREDLLAFSAVLSVSGSMKHASSLSMARAMTRIFRARATMAFCLPLGLAIWEMLPGTCLGVVYWTRGSSFLPSRHGSNILCSR